MKIFMMILIILNLSFLAGEFKFNYLNLDIGQNFAIIWNEDKEVKYESNQLLYPQANIEVMSFNFPGAKSFFDYFSLETCALLGLKESEFFSDNHYIYRANLGMTVNYPSKLRFKTGTRYLSILLSGGLYEDLIGRSFGFQVISKYKRDENEADEAVFLKYYAYYDMMDDGINQGRCGVSLVYNVPRLNGEMFDLIKGSTTPKKMWRNRSIYFAILGCLIGGTGYYFNDLGDKYYDDYQKATVSDDAINLRNKADKNYTIRDVCYYGSTAPLLTSLISLIMNSITE